MGKTNQIIYTFLFFFNNFSLTYLLKGLFFIIHFIEEEFPINFKNKKMGASNFLFPAAYETTAYSLFCIFSDW